MAGEPIDELVTKVTIDSSDFDTKTDAINKKVESSKTTQVAAAKAVADAQKQAAKDAAAAQKQAARDAEDAAKATALAAKQAAKDSSDAQKQAAKDSISALKATEDATKAAAKAQSDAAKAQAQADKESAGLVKTAAAADKKAAGEVAAAKKTQDAADKKIVTERTEQAKELREVMAGAARAGALAFAAVSGGRSVLSAISSQSAQDAQTGRRGDVMGISSQTLRGWENVFTSNGAGKDEAGNVLQSLVDANVAVKTGTEVKNQYALAKLGIGVSDFANPAAAMEKGAQQARDMSTGTGLYKGQGEQKTKAIAALKEAFPGLSDFGALALISPDRKAQFDKGVKDAPSDEVLKNAADRAKGWEGLFNTVGKDISEFTNDFDGSIKHFISSSQQLADYIADPAHAVTRDVVGGGLLAGIAASAYGGLKWGLGKVAPKAHAAVEGAESWAWKGIKGGVGGAGELALKIAAFSKWMNAAGVVAEIMKPSPAGERPEDMAALHDGKRHDNLTAPVTDESSVNKFWDDFGSSFLDYLTRMGISSGSTTMTGGNSVENGGGHPFATPGTSSASGGRASASAPGAGGTTDVAPPSDGSGAADVLEAHMGERPEQFQSFLNSSKGKAGSAVVNAATTAWCASTVNAVLAACGIKGDGSAVATSFMNWGRALKQDEEVKRNDVMVLNRGKSAGQTGGHVGLATGEVRRDANGHITQVGMVSGNEGGKVSHSWEDVGSVKIRRATQPDARNEVETADRGYGSAIHTGPTAAQRNTITAPPSQTSSISNNSMTVGNVTVHTQATDGPGVAAALRDDLSRRQALAGMANSSVVA